MLLDLKGVIENIIHTYTGCFRWMVRVYFKSKWAHSQAEKDAAD